MSFQENIVEFSMQQTCLLRQNHSTTKTKVFVLTEAGLKNKFSLVCKVTHTLTYLHAKKFSFLTKTQNK
jgi:hypothetical protein